MFEKTCAATQKTRKSHVFWILKKKRHIRTLEPVPIIARRPDFRVKCPASRADHVGTPSVPIYWRYKLCLRKNCFGPL